MKKRIAVLLTLVMIFSAFCAVPASADGEDTFHFHTRTAEYSFCLLYTSAAADD